ncbi:MAG: hypothetical protein LKJ13_05150 [Clostridia bacterium]|jgi:hypothetical protein|nr:hypothetical protein [Clostridia bacterium]MCI1999672.1 hypothetical protein [Clostridia bacterium]MCI2013949.1 hypothetical protein [Clostridia bacterium]
MGLFDVFKKPKNNNENDVYIYEDGIGFSSGSFYIYETNYKNTQYETYSFSTYPDEESCD